ncbi:MAG: amino acid ABC transporter permease, partial [Erysipelotrichaceae bacterium]|nr:amino acid ABC transporter permease [Erysipelotrichaceae bacterium]
INIDIFICALLVFGLNSGAYLAEIIRAGIEDVNKGQIEAAKALGVSRANIIKDIILPQAIRKVLPAIINEFITLTKETSVVSVLGINDMMKRYSFVVAKTYSPIEPLMIIGVAYYLLNKVLSFIGKFIERRMKYD